MSTRRARLTCPDCCYARCTSHLDGKNVCARDAVSSLQTKPPSRGKKRYLPASNRTLGKETVPPFRPKGRASSRPLNEAMPGRSHHSGPASGETDRRRRQRLPWWAALEKAYANCLARRSKRRPKSSANRSVSRRRTRPSRKATSRCDSRQGGADLQPLQRAARPRGRQMAHGGGPRMAGRGRFAARPRLADRHLGRQARRCRGPHHLRVDVEQIVPPRSVQHPPEGPRHSTVSR